jgi:hypothetical protein
MALKTGTLDINSLLAAINLSPPRRTASRTIAEVLAGRQRRTYNVHRRRDFLSRPGGRRLDGPPATPRFFRSVATSQEAGRVLSCPNAEGSARILHRHPVPQVPLRDRLHAGYLERKATPADLRHQAAGRSRAPDLPSARATRCARRSTRRPTSTFVDSQRRQRAQLRGQGVHQRRLDARSRTARTARVYNGTTHTHYDAKRDADRGGPAGRDQRRR